MDLNGRSIIGFAIGGTEGEIFRALNPVSGDEIDPEYFSATVDELDRAAKLAATAAETYRRTSGKLRANFLRTIAAKIESLGEPLVARCAAETALAEPRIKSETARTCFQLRMFANLVEEGSWVSARIDRSDPSRLPLPKPDMRSMCRPLGPVAVFCASNFPLAYSVAGGDTASALAAGNPVIVRAHAAHPGTAEMIGQMIRDAARECGMPEGVFSLLFDARTEIGVELVKHPLIQAAGFTGSQAGGRALMDAAASRPNPIPMFAEMGSTNPIFILPGALKERGAEIVKGLHASVTNGAGQFCTKPGVIIPSAEAAEASREFRAQLTDLMNSSGEFTLLTPRIHEAYLNGTKNRAREDDIRQISKVEVKSKAAGFQVGAALFETDAETFLHRPELQAEIFGPDTLLVQNAGRAELLEIARGLEGHLTATVHGTEADLREYAELISILETKAGRLIFNGFPTGLEVCDAVVHGGPYPAASDARFTAVGTRAVYRFTRLVCFQNFPSAALPDELKNENPLGISRLVDGKITREPIPRAQGAVPVSKASA